MKALERFSCNHKVNSIKGMFQKDKKVTSVIPIRPSSRDMFLMSQNAMPVLWHNKLPREAKKNKNIAIYLDVSGSVTSMLPMLLGFIKNMNRSIKTIYCFSNIVSEHSIQELSNGVFKTTGGTDFNCIAQHVLDNKQIDKAVIFTDGFADISNNLKAPLKAQLKDAAVVYFGSYVNKDNFFAKEYKKGFDLDELVQ
jgi:predicted metal-dependent peptidase